MALVNINSFNTSTMDVSNRDPQLGPPGLVSLEISQLFERILLLTTLPISLVGIVTNLINIRVFVAQGLSDSTTIGLFFLSIFDLLGCITLIPMSLCYIIWLVKGLALQMTCLAFTNIPTSYPHLLFSKVSHWITVYVSVERSICVVLPLKVKQIFTPRTSILTVVLIFLLLLVIHIPYPIYTRILWVHHPLLNQTIGYAHDTPTGKAILKVVGVSMSVLTTFAMVIVFPTTWLMVFKLLKFRKWRQSNMASDMVSNIKEKDNKTTSKQANSSKDIELIKSVLIVTTVFLVCMSMSHVPNIAVPVIPGTSLSGHNRNLFIMLFSVNFLFDAINAAINFFFYIRISTRYQTAFKSVFYKSAKIKFSKTKL